ncbi:MAG: lipoyl(octanoyl) transferase [Verrucomicrobia bacterium GWF2_51_19]|nr:MAG: lipoyl(octanoyl) transferase [Verrucomicrobia bacterium GWF2_51_19]HCJ12253.1 lipoate-protein ligase B [Opitutae bacterium]
MNILFFGKTHYLDALQRQRELVDQRVAGRIDDTLIFTEHFPVITFGSAQDSESNLLVNRERLAQEGIECCQTSRGGNITYHGPGQLICYPIVQLKNRDLHAYLRSLESVILETIAAFGLRGQRIAGKTGIWIENRKIAAIGIAVKHWVTYHGFALNVNPDLAHFQYIVPCGITPEEGTVTSMANELPQCPTLAAVQSAAQKAFATVLI